MKLAVNAPTASELDSLSSSIGFEFTDIGDLFSGPTGLVTLFVMFAGILLLLYLIMGGYEMMTSGGVPEKMAAGKQKITGGLIGFAIVLFAFLIVRVIATILDIDSILDIFG